MVILLSTFGWSLDIQDPQCDGGWHAELQPNCRFLKSVQSQVILSLVAAALWGLYLLILGAVEICWFHQFTAMKKWWVMTCQSAKPEVTNFRFIAESAMSAFAVTSDVGWFWSRHSDWHFNNEAIQPRKRLTADCFLCRKLSSSKETWSCLVGLWLKHLAKICSKNHNILD